MNRSTLSLILVSVLMSSVAQIVLKAGMTSHSIVQSLSAGSRWSAVLSIGTNPKVLCGLGIYFAGAVVWLLVLARVEVSLAYPFVGIGFVVTMLLGWLIHDDAVTLSRIAGTLLIATGVVVLGRS
jgi:multidrug transporter EmrE-like cation transporter